MPTFTYDELQIEPVDQVKFYLRQTGTTASTRVFSDEEISAAFSRATIRTTRAKVYWTAADMLSSLIARFAQVGGGLESGQISKLRVVYGGDSTKTEELERLRDKYQLLAARYSRVKPRMARILNADGARR